MSGLRRHASVKEAAGVWHGGGCMGTVSGETTPTCLLFFVVVVLLLFFWGGGGHCSASNVKPQSLQVMRLPVIQFE